jgi:hypothetical protein
MSTNSERITYHNQLIDRAKSKVDELPDKEGGGAAIETCTVNVRVLSGGYYAATCVEEGTIVAKTTSGIQSRFGGGDLEVVSVENVVCGSVFSLYTGEENTYETLTGATLLRTEGTYGYWFLITASKGGTVTINT